VRGTFKLTYQGADPNSVVHTYDVSDVNWTVPTNDPSLRVIGSGTYQIGSPDPIGLLQHRLQLDLRVGDEPVAHFDSGWVPVDQNGGIHITVSMNGMFCFDTVFRIAALPVPPHEIQPYALVDGSTFQRGCWNPCDCLLEQERPLAGTFDLVPLVDNGTWAEFAVVNAHWAVPATAIGDVVSVTGFGVYQRFSEFAVQHRLALELVVANDNRTHFDSGLVVSTEPFPRIDIAINMNQMICFDIVMHVIADPQGGEVCGGFLGIPCPDGQFCKYPMGSCFWADHFGVCTPIPQGCPEIYDPVCGCDGVTYGNECEADAARVTVDHPGECEPRCRPNPDGFGCTTLGCVDIPEVMCLGTLLHLDISTGAITTRACDCLDMNMCHIEFGNASPFAVGYCPDGSTCEVFAHDTNGDGIDDEFSAGCVGAPIGACCLDIDDGPVAFDTCVSTDAESCNAQGGIFVPGPTDCDRTQACCLSSAGSGLCADLLPMCCVFSGGIAQGEGTTCANLPDLGGCGQSCGGIAGPQCEDPDQFCMLPVGGCCCDIMGVCTTPPTDCPLIFDPVCGCDGVTYGNACEAAAAGQSINNIGPCVGNCPDVWDPVCGVNGVTYSNACFAEAAGVPIAHPGECGAVCGGLGPYPPCPPTEFCKFPPGVCADPTVPGECVPYPGGCPDVWEPVCGCDGQTYSNECDANAAGVSIAHFGECNATGCAATRVLGDPDPTYCPGVPKTVHILLAPPAGVTAIALDDAPPAGWVVTHISDGGTFDAAHGKVKWGPFFAPEIPGEVSYRVVSPAIDVNAACFAGTISLDGVNSAVCGEACIPGVHCCPHMAADKPEAPCTDCPAGGCDNATGSCDDGRISLTELISYACAWLMGCNDDLSGMTRAAFVWRTGECYCWDEADLNWHPTTCPAPSNGCCAAPPANATDGSGGSVEATILWNKLKRSAGTSRDGLAAKAREIQVEVSIVPPGGTQATALEMDIPAGWSVIDTSEGGQWDEAHHKVKWGPIFGDAPLAMTYTLKRLPDDVAPMAHRYAGGISPRGIEGTVSFDGINQSVSTR